MERKGGQEGIRMEGKVGDRREVVCKGKGTRGSSMDGKGTWRSNMERHTRLLTLSVFNEHQNHNSYISKGVVETPSAPTFRLI